jgi:hypothetical protein
MARRRLPAGGGGPAELPATLFANGEDGAWIDPSDLTTTWQDSIGGTPAGVGDPVAFIEDKSGNGNHYHTNTSTTARPILRNPSAGIYSLEQDGSDDVLFSGPAPGGIPASPWANTTITDAVICMGYKERTRKNSWTVQLGNPASASVRWLASAPFGDGNLYFDCGGTSAPNRVSAAWPVAVGNALVATFVNSVTDSEQLARVNGTQIAGDATGHSVTVSGFASIGGIAAAGNRSANDVYGFVTVVTRNLTAQEISDLESWMAGKSGVTL